MRPRNATHVARPLFRAPPLTAVGSVFSYGDSTLAGYGGPAFLKTRRFPMSASLRPIQCGLFFFLAAGASTVHLAGQAVTGTVVDATNQAIVATAEVQLITADSQRVAQALTRSDGTFIVFAPSEGVYSLRISRLGYRTMTTDPLELQEAQTLRVKIDLPVQAVDLPALRVLGRVQGIRQRQLWNFHQRVERYERWKGIRVFSREELEQHDVWTYEEFLRRLGPRIATPGGRCEPVVYWNGQKLKPDPLMTIGFFEGIEFYDGYGPTGSSFINYDHCGVILVWSRSYFAEDPSGG